MGASSHFEVTDREGWRKQSPLQKSITYIGSDPTNDIVLERARGSGVAARHAQLIAWPSSQGYRLVNIGDREIWLGPSSAQAISPHSFVDLTDGDSFRIGDFILVFHGNGQSASAPGGDRTAGAIGLRLVLPQVQLHPDRSLDGAVLVRNLGDKPGAQFKLEVEGLERQWYEMGPGPILFPGAEKEVAFRIYHPRAPQPPAGDHTIRIRAIAPDAYPGTSAVISQVIRILPFYSHKLRLENSD
jgi:hypothetical protein